MNMFNTKESAPKYASFYIFPVIDFNLEFIKSDRYFIQIMSVKIKMCERDSL